MHSAFLCWSQLNTTLLHSVSEKSIYFSTVSALKVYFRMSILGPKLWLARSLSWTQRLQFYQFSHVRVVLVVQMFLALLRGENFSDEQQVRRPPPLQLLLSRLPRLLSFLSQQRIKKQRYFKYIIFYLSKIFPTLAAFASLFSWRALYPCRSSKTCILNSFGLTQKDHKYTQGHRHRHHRPVHLLLHVLLLDLSLHYLLLLVRWTTVEDTPDICHRHSGGDGVIIFSLKSKNRKLKLEMSIFHAIL